MLFLFDFSIFVVWIYCLKTVFWVLEENQNLFFTLEIKNNNSHPCCGHGHAYIKLGPAVACAAYSWPRLHPRSSQHWLRSVALTGLDCMKMGRLMAGYRGAMHTTLHIFAAISWFSYWSQNCAFELDQNGNGLELQCIFLCIALNLHMLHVCLQSTTCWTVGDIYHFCRLKTEGVTNIDIKY